MGGLLGHWSPAGSAGDATSGVAGGRCGRTRADTPICRVQARLSEPGTLERATTLLVAPTGSRWAHAAGFAAALVLAAALLTRISAAMWRHRSNLADVNVDLLIRLSGLTACAWALSVTWAQSRSPYNVFVYKRFVPVPAHRGGPLRWEYYLKTALPDADVEDLARAGGGDPAVEAARAAAPFQGGLSLAQVRIKTNDAIRTLLEALQPKGDAFSDHAEDLARVKSACEDADAAHAMLGDGLEVARTNGLTRSALEGVVRAGPAGRPADLSRKLLAAAGSQLEPGLPGAPAGDDAWRQQAAAALEVAVPRILQAHSLRADAVKLMASLDDRLRPAAEQLGVEGGSPCDGALQEALSAVPSPAAGLDAVKASKALTDKEIARADAALGVASAAMDTTVLRSIRGSGKRMAVFVSATFAAVAATALIWGAYFLVRIGLEQSFAWVLAAAGETVSFLNNTETGVQGIIQGLQVATKFLIVFGVGAAFVYNRRLAGIMSEVKYTAHEALLERVGSALRAMVKAGGVRAALTEGPSQRDFLHALSDLEAVMQHDLLTDKTSYATSPVRISDLIVFGTLMLGCTVALYVLWLEMMPGKALVYMKMRADAGASAPMPAPLTGGGSLPELTNRDIEYFRKFSFNGTPDTVRAVVMLMSLVSLAYYLMHMVVNEANARDIYYNELTVAAKNHDIVQTDAPGRGL